MNFIFIDQKICWASVAKSISPNWLFVSKRLMSIVSTIAIVDPGMWTLSYLWKSSEKVSGKSTRRRLCTNCATRTATETKTYPCLRLGRMLSGHLSRKICISSLLYFMLGKYDLLLSNFRCCHENRKVDETRRSDFRLFQVLLTYLFSFLLLVTRSQIRKENISRWLLISAVFCYYYYFIHIHTA